MARILSDEEKLAAEMIHNFDLHNKIDKKLNFLISVLEKKHKNTFFHKLFNPKCKICKALKMVK